MEKAIKDLSINFGCFNELVIKNNEITGEFKWPIANDNKLPLLKITCQKLKINFNQVIAVGDDDNDIPKFKATGFSIAFNTTSRELREVADIVIEGNDLINVLEKIKELN